MITKTHRYLFNKLPERVKNKIRIEATGCWEWEGEINRNGYGRCWLQGVRYMAHRLIYSLLISEITQDNLLDHLCSNRCCVNPTHLSQVTPRQNIHRGKATLYKQMLIKN